MNAIMELNYRMVNNLNEKLKLAYQNKIAKKWSFKSINLS